MDHLGIENNGDGAGGDYCIHQIVAIGENNGAGPIPIGSRHIEGYLELFKAFRPEIFFQESM